MSTLNDTYKNLRNNFSWRSDRFHKSIQNIKNNKNHLSETPLEWIRISFKTYPRMKKIIFEKPTFKSQLTNLLLKRRSVKTQSEKPLSKKIITSLIFYSCGIIEIPNGNINFSRRSYPSAGGRYPLEMYVLVLKSSDLNKGLYHYNVKDNTLEVLDEGNFESKAEKMLLEKWALKASALFIITGIFDRSRIKYSDRGYMYALIEAGYVSQNLCLLSTDLNLNICPIGGFLDEEVRKFLDISLNKEYPITILAVS